MRWKLAARSGSPENIMPKLKTNRGAAKRFKLTGSGKVRYNKMNRRHILTKKSQKRKRQLRASGTLSGGDAKLVKKLIPYA